MCREIANRRLSPLLLTWHRYCPHLRLQYPRARPHDHPHSHPGFRPLQSISACRVEGEQDLEQRHEMERKAGQRKMGSRAGGAWKQGQNDNKNRNSDNNLRNIVEFKVLHLWQKRSAEKKEMKMFGRTKKRSPEKWIPKRSLFTFEWKWSEWRSEGKWLRHKYRAC